jgi:hypothetical protein
VKTYSFEATLKSSQKSAWQLDDVLGPGHRLDFARPFLPESLARVEGLDFLDAREKRVLNQIRGNTYLRVFGIVEEFILPFVLDHARPHLAGDDWRVRGLLQFAGEEAKHIHLFKRFQAEFDRGFGTTCEVIGPSEAIGQAILAHDPLGVALAILSIEWRTQRHFVDSVQGDERLDPLFKSLLKHHWMEEAQHAKLDTLVVDALVEGRDEAGIARGVDAYLAIGAFIDAGLKQQVEFDLDAFQRATGRRLAPAELERARVVQMQANRWTYLGSGMTHPEFLGTVEALGFAHRAKIEEVAPAFC